MKDCFGHVIKDSSKLEECRTCVEREACRAVQWDQDVSSVRILPQPRGSRSPESS